MIAFDFLPVPIVLGAVTGLVALLFGLDRIARHRVELRVRLLETLSLAVRRGAPLAPLLRRMAEEERGRTRRIVALVAARLESGGPLADALQHGAPRHFPRSLTAGLRAAEGRACLGPVLDALARSAERAESMIYRALRAGAYPAGLALTFALVHWACTVHASVAQDSPPSGAGPGSPWLVVAWVALLALAIGSLGRFQRGVEATACWILRVVPPLARWSELPGCERVLRVLASTLRAGRPLAEALADAAPAAGSRRLERRLLDAADRIADGEEAAHALAAAGFPGFVRERLVLQCRTSAAALASAMERLATQCRERFERSLDRGLVATSPAAVVAFGILLALDFERFIEAHGLILQRSIGG